MAAALSAKLGCAGDTMAVGAWDGPPPSLGTRAPGSTQQGKHGGQNSEGTGGAMRHESAGDRKRWARARRLTQAAEPWLCPVPARSHHTTQPPRYCTPHQCTHTHTLCSSHPESPTSSSTGHRAATHTLTSWTWWYITKCRGACTPPGAVHCDGVPPALDGQGIHSSYTVQVGRIHHHARSMGHQP